MTLVAIFLQVQICIRFQYLDSFLDIGGHTGPIHWIITMAATEDEILRGGANIDLCRRQSGGAKEGNRGHFRAKG